MEKIYNTALENNQPPPQKKKNQSTDENWRHLLFSCCTYVHYEGNRLGQKSWDGKLQPAPLRNNFEKFRISGGGAEGEASPSVVTVQVQYCPSTGE